MMQRPLRGVRVLDMTRILAGPYASMILGDLGAEIIKIERPNVGDDTRRWGPPFKDDQSVYFLSVNRNKKSVSVDFKKAKGAELLRSLAAKSDVLMENYIPGKLESVGLDYASLSKINSKLVYCSLTGFGQTGPWSNRAGYDVVAAAAGGLMHITGAVDGPPCRVGVAVTDMTTGLYSVTGILSALIQRQITSKGCHVDANLLSSQLATMSMAGANYLIAGVEGKRWGTGHPSIVPYQAFPTADDAWILIGAGNDLQFVDLCRVLKLESIANDERFKKNEDRVRNRSHIVSILEESFKEKPKREWMTLFERENVRFSFSPVNSVGEAFNLEQAKHLGMVQSLEHQNGSISVPGPALRFSQGQDNWTGFGQEASPPPQLGADTDSVMKDLLGMSHQEIEKLKEEGVLG